MSVKYTKTIIILANSRKISGRCVAGREVAGSAIGDWIRPVSSRPAGELSEEERRFEDGKDPRLGDVVRIPMIEHRPHGFQTENHLIDDGYYWTKERVANWADLEAALDRTAGPLWENSSSSYNGMNDRVEETVANKLSCSLRLIRVTDLKIVVGVEGAEFRKRKIRGHFTCNRAQYWLTITDPAIEREYLSQPDGEYKIGQAILCISLGEPYGGYAYKLVAGVFLKRLW